MVTEITKGVRVSVETEYQSEYSNPAQLHCVFTYKITIENNSNYTVQLKRRKWHISDATYPPKTVEGDGVVGLQPILEPGHSHQYVSGCNLKTGIGKMTGIYQMERVVDGKFFDVIIPEFNLIVPFKLN